MSGGGYNGPGLNPIDADGGDGGCDHGSAAFDWICIIAGFLLAIAATAYVVAATWPAVPIVVAIGATAWAIDRKGRDE